MLESTFQKQLIQTIKKRLPGCIVTKFKPDGITGFPDLIIFYNDRWALLEVKRDATASHQPNQDYWVNKLNDMSFAAFIYPENKEEVLDVMEEALCQV